MTLTEAIARLRRACHDLSDEYTTADCLAFLNEAVQETAVLLASLRYPPLIRETILTSGDRLPDDCIAPVGVHPYRLTSGRVQLTDGHERITLRYYSAPPRLTEDDALPYDDTICEAILLAAVIRALRQNEYDTSAEEAHLANLRAALAAALGAKGRSA